MHAMKDKLELAKLEIGKIIKDLNSSTACFTGHRSQKLPWRFNENDERCLVMRNTLTVEIEKAIQRGYKTFLCGMALGFDMICAETVLKLKEKYSYIKLNSPRKGKNFIENLTNAPQPFKGCNCFVTVGGGKVR